MEQLFLQIECTKFQNKNNYNSVEMSDVFMQIPSSDEVSSMNGRIHSACISHNVLSVHRANRLCHPTHPKFVFFAVCQDKGIMCAHLFLLVGCDI